MKPCKMLSRCSRRMLDEVWCSWNDVWVNKGEFLVRFLLKKDARRKMTFELSKKWPMKKTTYIYEMKMKWCRFNKNASASRWRTAADTTAAVVAPRQMHRDRDKKIFVARPPRLLNRGTITAAQQSYCCRTTAAVAVPRQRQKNLCHLHAAVRQN